MYTVDVKVGSLRKSHKGRVGLSVIMKNDCETD